MKNLILLLLLIPFISCQTPSKVTDEEVMEAFETFFDLLDNDLDDFGSIVTDDFYIFENSRRYSKEEFIEFVNDFDIINGKRDFENITIEADYHSAHITLTHFGEFRVNSAEGEIKMNFEWLESAYLVKEDGTLKFKFYFSEAINKTTIKIE